MAILLVSDHSLLDPTLLPKKILLTIALVVFGIYLIIRGLRKRLYPENIYRHKIFFLIAILYLLVRGLGIFYSYSFADGLFEFSKDFLQLVLVFYFLLSFRNFQEFSDKGLFPIVLFALVISFYGIFQIIVEINNGNYNVDASYNIKTFFGHRNIYAQILVLTIPMLLAKGIKDRRFQRVTLSLLSIIVLLIILLFSRTAWLSIFGALSLTGILVAIKAFRNNQQKELLSSLLRNKSMILIPVTILVLLILSLGIAEKNEFYKLTHNLTKWDYGSSQKRIKAWEGSFQLIGDRPLVGHGTASWKIEVLKYISDNKISNSNMTFYQRPHNDFLWVWTENGSVGILLYVLMFFYLFRHNWRYFRKDNEILSLSLIPLFGLIAYVIIASLSFPRERIEHGVFLSFFMIQTLLIKENKEENRLGLNWFISMLLIFSLVSLSFFYYVDTFRIRGEVLLRQAFQFRSKQLNSEVISSVHQAENKYFNMDYTSMPISWYSGCAYYNLEMYDLALAEFNKSLELNPYNINILLNAGSAYYKLENLDKAREMYLSAFELNQKNSDVLINLSVIAFQNGNLDLSLGYIESINLKDLNIGHKKIIIKILDHKMQELISEERNSPKAEILRRMTLSKKWLYNLLIKSNENDVNFETMVYLDVDYVLRNY